MIEAYVVSSDEYGNFFKAISFQTLPTATTKTIGFSVPIDVSNAYIDYRVGNKVYVKLKNQFIFHLVSMFRKCPQNPIKRL